MNRTAYQNVILLTAFTFNAFSVIFFNAYYLHTKGKRVLITLEKVVHRKSDHSEFGLEASDKLKRSLRKFNFVIPFTVAMLILSGVSLIGITVYGAVVYNGALNGSGEGMKWMSVIAVILNVTTVFVFCIVNTLFVVW